MKQLFSKLVLIAVVALCASLGFWGVRLLIGRPQPTTELVPFDVIPSDALSDGLGSKTPSQPNPRPSTMNPAPPADPVVPEFGSEVSGTIMNADESQRLLLVGPQEKGYSDDLYSQTGTSGHFSFSKVATGTYNLFLGEPQQDQLLLSGLFVPKDGSLAPLNLQLPEQSASLRIVMAEPSPQSDHLPIMGLWAETEDQKLWPTAKVHRALSLEGEQLLEQLPVGAFSIAVQPSTPGFAVRFQPAHIELTEYQETTVQIRLLPVTELHVFGTKDSKPFRDLLIMDGDGRNRWKFQRVDQLIALDTEFDQPALAFSDREAIARYLPEGHYILEAIGEGNAHQRLEVDLKVGSLARLTIRFPGQ